MWLQNELSTSVCFWVPKKLLNKFNKSSVLWIRSYGNEPIIKSKNSLLFVLICQWSFLFSVPSQSQNNFFPLPFRIIKRGNPNEYINIVNEFFQLKKSVNSFIIFTFMHVGYEVEGESRVENYDYWLNFVSSSNQIRAKWWHKGPSWRNLIKTIISNPHWLTFNLFPIVLLTVAVYKQGVRIRGESPCRGRVPHTSVFTYYFISVHVWSTEDKIKFSWKNLNKQLWKQDNGHPGVKWNAFWLINPSSTQSKCHHPHVHGGYPHAKISPLTPCSLFPFPIRGCNRTFGGRSRASQRGVVWGCNNIEISHHRLSIWHPYFIVWE